MLPLFCLFVGERSLVHQGVEFGMVWYGMVHVASSWARGIGICAGPVASCSDSWAEFCLAIVMETSCEAIHPREPCLLLLITTERERWFAVEGCDVDVSEVENRCGGNF